ncbi:hypothetical protein HK101_007300 [Irineochytrium annulatum]|nr:hypothetical protein HK101_007300 [Irineochytrium annulatum]
MAKALVTGSFWAVGIMTFDFNGLEVIPLLAEDVIDYRTKGPLAILLAAATLIFQEWGYVLCFSGLPPGLFAMSESLTGSGIMIPIMEYYELDMEGPIFFWLNVFFNYFMCVPTVLVYVVASTRLSYALSRTGYMPNALSFTKMPFNLPPAPWVAGIFCICVVMVLCSVSIIELSEFGFMTGLSSQLMLASNIYICVAYALTGLAYLYLHHYVPSINRPWKSGFGPLCAWITVAMNCLIMASMMSANFYYIAAYFALAKISVGLLYMIWARKHLVLSPEGKRNLFSRT